MAQRITRLFYALLAGAVINTSHATQPGRQHTMAATNGIQAGQQTTRLTDLFTAHHITTAGAAIITGGHITWTTYYGEQSPGVPTSATTQFNVASITKTVTAETILRLVNAGTLSLDQPMARHWIDPDIAGDPRHRQLTARMALNHTSGFPNWRFFTADKKLSFMNNPGTTFGYSGEGFEYLARYAEAATGQSFDTLVQEFVFTPLQITHAAFAIRADNFGNIAQAMDEHGKFPGHYCRPNGWCRSAGEYSAADDLVISVADYAKFLIAAARHQGYNPQLARDRNRVQTAKGRHATVDCNNPEQHCPQAQGYGLGWDVLDYGERTFISHGGSDWSELALAYIERQSLDGVVIFINGLSQHALAAMPAVIQTLDADSPYIDLYQRRYEASLNNE